MMAIVYTLAVIGALSVVCLCILGATVFVTHRNEELDTNVCPVCDRPYDGEEDV